MVDALSAGPSGWGWLAMGMSVLVLAGLAVGAYRLLLRGASGSVGRASAQRRLAEQFARGQVTEQEYRHLSAELDAPRASRAAGVEAPGQIHGHRAGRRRHPGDRGAPATVRSRVERRRGRRP